MGGSVIWTSSVVNSVPSYYRQSDFGKNLILMKVLCPWASPNWKCSHCSSCNWSRPCWVFSEPSSRWSSSLTFLEDSSSQGRCQPTSSWKLQSVQPCLLLWKGPNLCACWGPAHNSEPYVPVSHRPGRRESSWFQPAHHQSHFLRLYWCAFKTCTRAHSSWFCRSTTTSSLPIQICASYSSSCSSPTCCILGYNSDRSSLWRRSSSSVWV